MKVICTTETELNKKTSCKKEYCCNKLKVAMEPYKKKASDYGGMNSHFELKDNGKVILETHSSYHDGKHEMTISHCPFCGEQLLVKKVKIDKTKDLPVQIVEKVVEKIVYVKKKHWWSEAK